MATDPTPHHAPRQGAVALAAAAAAAACLAPLAVFMALLMLMPSLLPRLLLRPSHVVPYVSSAALHHLDYDGAAATISYNLSAALRFDGPGQSGLARAAPFYSGQELGRATGLKGFPTPAAWAGLQSVPAGRARAVAAAFALEAAAGRFNVKVAVTTVQNGVQRGFACVLSFPAPRNGSAAALLDGHNKCMDDIFLNDL